MTQTPLALVRDRPFNQNLYLNLACRGYFLTTYFSDTAFSVENIKHAQKIVDENKRVKVALKNLKMRYLLRVLQFLSLLSDLKSANYS